MRVFILCTGRTGSVSFAKACQHISNYTSGHETQVKLLGDARISYPDNHIEADNRLSWFLGGMDKKYGDEAYYVHLHRNHEETAKSFAKRFDLPGSIVTSFKDGILMQKNNKLTAEEKHQVCLDYVITVNNNIGLFLKDKSKVQSININEIKDGFEQFFTAIKAEGDLIASLKEFDTQHNASETISTFTQVKKSIKNILK